MRTRIDEEEIEREESLVETEEHDGGAEAIAFEQASRPAEEFRMLIIGFATGITVALVFLVYIIAAAAHALP